MVNPPGYPTFADTDSDPADTKKDISGHEMVRVGHQGHGPRRARRDKKHLIGWKDLLGFRKFLVHSS